MTFAALTLPAGMAVGDPPPEPPATERPWYLAACHRCGFDLAVPFRSEVDRDAWAIDHAEATGHSVVLSNDAQDGRGILPVVVLRFEDGGWFWCCASPPDVCAEQDYDETGQLALAGFRAHAHRPAPRG